MSTLYVPPPSTRRRSARPYVFAVLALLIVGAAAGTGLYIGSLDGDPPVFASQPADSVRGTFTLTTTGYGQISSSSGSCQGTGGYSDITPGVTVTLRSADGTLLGASHLESGIGTATGLGGKSCTFGFAFTGVDLGSDPDALFTVAVGSNGRRGEVPFTRQQLLSPGPQLTLGG